MPTQEQLLRKEQDLFSKLESETESARTSAMAADELSRVPELREVREMRTKVEKLPPSALAELPQQSQASQEAVRHLFHHFSERLRKGELTPEEQEHHSATQTDPRTTSESREPLGSLRRDNERADEFKDGMAADFVTDSQVSAAAMDERPSSAIAPTDGLDAWEGAPGRRRRRRGASTAAKPKKREGKG
jgi:hypothetical protein